ncbi:hypothetical protein [Kaistia sp. MMO-174]|uniref:hypothetical protein n=1 Tax=Kaistia sp. MMO-174 TaxID=3081256 RepID=UPI003017B6A0
MSNTALRAILTEIAAATIKPQPPASTATMEDWRNRQIERFRRKGAEALALLDQDGGDADRGGWRPIDSEAKSGAIVEVLTEYNGSGRKLLVQTARYIGGDFSLIDEDGDETGSNYLIPIAWRPAPEPTRPTLEYSGGVVQLNDGQARGVRAILEEDDPFSLATAFRWSDTPQGRDFWEGESHRDSLSDTARAILTASLRAHYESVGGGLRFFEGGEQISRGILIGEYGPTKLADAFSWSSAPQGTAFWDREGGRSALSDEARRILVAALYLHDAKGEIS